MEQVPLLHITYSRQKKRRKNNEQVKGLHLHTTPTSVVTSSSIARTVSPEFQIEKNENRRSEIKTRPRLQ
jgi:hypothetical protein